MGEKITKQKQRHDRGWKLAKQTARNCNQSFEAKIKQAWKKEITISTNFLNESLKNTANYLGCYAENQLNDLRITSFPCYLIVNIDSSDMVGSHWVALGLFRENIEIFDSLGFDMFNWTRIPCNLFNFLHRQSRNKRVIISPRIQNDESSMCGFYCIYYIISRAFNTFTSLTNYFDLNDLTLNDSKLIQFFK